MILAIQLLSAIALVTFIILVIRLLFSLNKFEKFIDESSNNIGELNKDLKTLSKKSIETLDNVNDMKYKADKALDSLEKFNQNLIKISDKGNSYVDDLRNLSKPYENLVKDTYIQIAEPVNKITNIFNAASKAVSVLKARLKK